MVFVTSDSSSDGRMRGFEAGATDFFVKPFQPGTLLAMASKILKAQDFLDGATALVVEDSSTIRHAVASMLKRRGLTVLEATNGEEGYQMASQAAPGLDLIITDYMMPGMNGQELCLKIRADPKLKDVPIVFLSGIDDKDLIVEMFQAGATDFLHKPFSNEELLARIHVHLKLSTLNRELGHRNLAMQEDLELAGEVQRAALHDQVEVDFLEKSVLYVPDGEVSGDVYDLSLNSGGDLCVLLGDATGHGVAAALMTMTVQSGLDGIGRDVSTEQTMEHLHRLIGERSGNRFVTAIYLTITPKGLLTFSRAGHPPLILLRDGEAPRPFTEQGGMPLGLLPTPLPFGWEQIQLLAGDRFFIYSDGVTEWEGPEKEQYGIPRLLDFLERSRQAPLQATVADILRDLRSFARGRDCNDDLTLIGFEYTG